MRRAASLVPALLRALPRGRLVAGAGMAFAVAWLVSPRLGESGAVIGAKYAALALCLGAATILDDPAAGTVAAAPRALLRRRAVTVALVAPVLALAWAAVVSVTAIGRSPAVALTLLLTALMLATLALAVALSRGGAAAGPAVVLGFVAVDAGAPPWAAKPDLGDWRWLAAWSGLAAFGLVVLLVASRDPARCRPRRMWALPR